MLRLRRRALLGPAVVHATTQARSSTTAASRPSSSSGQTTPSNASSSSSSSSMGAMLAAGVLLAAAADLGYPQYQQIEADRRAAAALRTGGAALPATTAAAGALPSSAGGVGHAGGPPAPIPITIEAASQRVQVVVVEKGSVGQHSGSSNGERLVFLPREALRRRVQGALAPRAMGRGGYVVITGPKGSGKSAVAARAQGAHVLYINLAASITADPSPSSSSPTTIDAEAAVKRALGLDSLPTHPPYQSLLGLAYGAAVRGLGGQQGQGKEGEEDEEVASVRRALRLLQRALVKAGTTNSPPPTIVIDHLDALRCPEAVALVQDWALQATATEQPPLASTVAVVAGHGMPALATLMGRPAWGGVAGQVQVPDLTEAEALAYLQLQTTAPPLRPSDARRLVALLGGRLSHLRRAVAGLGGSGGTGVQDVALEACEGMRSGYDRLMSLPAAAFLPPSTQTTTTTTAQSTSGCCRHKGVVTGWSSSSSSAPTPNMHALLAALLHAASKTLPLPTAARHLLPGHATADAETGLAHRLLAEQGGSTVLTLLPPARAGDPPRVGFASPLAEKFGYAYLSAYRHAGAGPGVSAEALVVAALAAEHDDKGGDEWGKKKKGRGGGGFPSLVSTALLAASAALYWAATGVGGGEGGGHGSASGGYKGIYLALPQAADMEALTKAAQGAVRASAAATQECARAVAGRLAAASHALGETLSAAAAAAAAGGSKGAKGGARGGAGGSV